MNTATEPAAKLPLIKRIVLMTRGLSGEGGSSIIVIILLVLCVIGCVFGFVGGLAIGTKHAQSNQQKLAAEVRAAKESMSKLASEKSELKRLSDEQAEKIGFEESDIEQLKEQVAKAKLEHEAMEKVLADIRDSLHEADAPKDGKTAKVAKAVQGAMLKFGSSECPLNKDGVSSKQDVKCMNLREAIDAMNGKAADADAKSTKPADGKSVK
jgi:uncharacterized protein YlxW (UPF0749 family)